MPFRLTHNILDGFGPLGVEGPYRLACEVSFSDTYNACRIQEKFCCYSDQGCESEPPRIRYNFEVLDSDLDAFVKVASSGAGYGSGS